MALKLQIVHLLSHPNNTEDSYYKFSLQEKQLTEYFGDKIPFPSAYGKLLTLHHFEWLDHLGEELKSEIRSKTIGERFNSIQSQIS